MSTPTAAPATPDSLERTLQDWANARNRPTICLVNRSGPEALRSFDVVNVWGMLDDGPFPEVDLIVHSPGGDPHSAYQLAELIRSRMSNKKSGLTAIIPFIAGSAATLLCLACDTIIFGELARMGPLDMQIYEPLKGGEYRFGSALHPQSALKQLNELSLASLLQTKTALVDDGLLGDEAYAVATTFAVGLYKDLYSQISPERLAEYSRALDVNLKYAKCLLERHSSLSSKEQDDLASKLVRDYPSHSYYIDFDEALALKLNVVRMPKKYDSFSGRLLARIYGAPAGVRVFMPATLVSTTEPPIEVETVPKKSKRSGPKKQVSPALRTPAVNGSSNGKAKVR